MAVGGFVDDKGAGDVDDAGVVVVVAVVVKG